jgi:hypothetical protein
LPKTRSAAVSSAAVLALVGQRVLAHEVQFLGLVGAGGQEGGLGQQLDLQRQQVAEDARQRDHHVDARPAQLGQRHQRAPARRP